jgi:hypothetical protein
VTGLIKDKVREKKAGKAGFRNVQEYRMERLRTLKAYDEDAGHGGEIITNVSEVLNDTSGVYDEYDKWAGGVGNQDDHKKQDEKSSLSVSKLLNATGEFTSMQTVLTATESATRREAIKSIILARQATY